MSTRRYIIAAAVVAIAVTITLYSSTATAPTLDEAIGQRILQKAYTALNKGISYQLGHGNNAWTGPLPTNDFLCDCMQYVTWATGTRDAYTTTWLRDDATGKQTKFRAIAQPVNGCIIAGDCPTGTGSYAGHVAIIVNKDDYTIIDCGKSQGGITVHKAPYWKNAINVVFCLPVSSSLPLAA